MKTQKEEFLHNFTVLLEEKYKIFKQTRVVEEFDRGVIHGAMSVGKGLGLVTYEELEEFLDIPTVIRKGLI